MKNIKFLGAFLIAATFVLVTCCTVERVENREFNHTEFESYLLTK